MGGRVSLGGFASLSPRCAPPTEGKRVEMDRDLPRLSPRNPPPRPAPSPALTLLKQKKEMEVGVVSSPFYNFTVCGARV